MNNTNLVDQLVMEKTLTTRRIINAFRAVDRVCFVPKDLRKSAYSDFPLPIGSGQTISQPTTVAFMLELLQSRKGNKILDIGAGSGWLTALLAEIVGQAGFVLGYEIDRMVGKFGKDNLSKTNLSNYEYRIEDVKKIFKKNLFFDRIIASAAFPDIPNELIDMLKDGGIMVVPSQDNNLIKISKIKSKIAKETYRGFIFVPMR